MSDRILNKTYFIETISAENTDAYLPTRWRSSEVRKLGVNTDTIDILAFIKIKKEEKITYTTFNCIIYIFQ